MEQRIMNSWSDYALKVDPLIDEAKTRIDILDKDLKRLGLEEKARVEKLSRFLSLATSNQLRIILRAPELFLTQNPRLANLLKRFSSQMIVYALPENIVMPKECMFLVDKAHGLIRFHEDQPRSKVVIDNSVECAPYHRRFAEILVNEPPAISITCLGL